MKTPGVFFSCAILRLFYLAGSLQLTCDKAGITAHIGGEFVLACNYDTNRFRFSKKYWCRGDSSRTCEILADSERIHKTGRSIIVDAGRRGLYVKVTNLQFDDTGAYWVGIDKVYADIMTSVSVVITEGKTTFFLMISLERVHQLVCYHIIPNIYVLH
uniref:Immunoglobulin V-set domain-containing protein n=1 Tax=Anabas testudineus TaxID=64144 RepID=A0A3Q1JJF7_ANATE